MLQSESKEIIDSDNYSKEELRDNFDDIIYFNRTFGIYKVINSYITQIVAKYQLTHVSILDVGTGAADIPVAIIKHFENKGVKITIDAIDNNPTTVSIAKNYASDFKGINIKNLNAFDLPLKKKYDIVLCCMALHHIPKEDKVIFLKKLDSIASKSLIVCDLVRSLHGYLSVLTLSFLVCKGRLTKNDASLSILRSVTKPDLASLAKASGFKEFIIKKHKFFKIFLITFH